MNNIIGTIEDSSMKVVVEMKGAGPQGIHGEKGKSIEYIWNGTQLGVRLQGETEYQYVDLKGEQGEQGIQGKNVEFNWNGTQLGVRVQGQPSYQYVDLKGEQGDTGDSAYQIWLNQGNTGTEAEWLESLKGEDGDTPVKGVDYFDGEQGIQGEQGLPGVPGKDGLNGESAYEIAARLGFEGTEEEWKESLKGIQGETGKSIEYTWDGTQLGVRIEGETDYTYVNLKGDKGDIGNTGKSLEFNWNGTQLGIRQEGDATFQYINLKGAKGDTGDTGDKGDTGNTGKSLEFNWNGTQLGVRVEGDATYQYVNLKGDKGDKGDPGVDGSIVDLGTFNDQTELITHVVMNQLPTGHYTFIMNRYSYFMLIERMLGLYRGTFYSNDAWVAYFQVSFDGEVTEFKNIDLKDLMTDVQM